MEGREVDVAVALRGVELAAGRPARATRAVAVADGVADGVAVGRRGVAVAVRVGTGRLAVAVAVAVAEGCGSTAVLDAVAVLSPGTAGDA